MTGTRQHFGEWPKKKKEKHDGPRIFIFVCVRTSVCLVRVQERKDGSDIQKSGAVAKPASYAKDSNFECEMRIRLKITAQCQSNMAA
jgi:hypothetical protein